VIALWVGLALILAGGVAPLVTVRWPRLGDGLYIGLLGFGTVLAGLPAVAVLANGTWADGYAASAVPLGPWIFGIDRLSAVFLLLVLGVGVATAVYGAGYLQDGRSRRQVAVAHLLFASLIVALACVVTARATLSLLVAWEAMALSAFALVMFEGDRDEVRHAGLVYFATTHAGTLALGVLFLCWHAATGEWTFDGFARHGALSPAMMPTLLLLGLLGFGLKAGMVPLHFWLPGAHAAAPSHVSAIMSGLVIKTGIYGLLRLTMLLGQPPAWWGWLLLAFGTASGVLGVLWALGQHDLKRLLAYHSVENIGIILMGAGVGALGMAYHSPLVAVLGMAGAVLHTVNHAVFKSLLFLGAGAVARSTGTRDLEHAGGLAHRMPVTAILFTIGSVAIVGLPPLNGFVSEWLVFRALSGAGLEATSLRLAVLAAAALALIGALALACFTKVGGALFFGPPRSAGARQAVEVGPMLLGPMVGLALVCALIGLLPGVAVSVVLDVGALVAGASASGPASGVMRSAALISGVAVSLVLAIAIAWAIRRRLLSGRPVERAPTWTCANDLSISRAHYTASSFAAPVLALFGAVSGVRVDRSAGMLHTHPGDAVFDRVLRPAWSRVRGVAGLVRGMQHGRIQIYLLYVVGTVIALLVYLGLWRP
jgi:hydrogenase-4 component B